MTPEQNVLNSTARELDNIQERLEELADWAEGEDYMAVTHKLEEALGKVAVAALACRQYASGVLGPMTK